MPPSAHGALDEDERLAEPLQLTHQLVIKKDKDVLIAECHRDPELTRLLYSKLTFAKYTWYSRTTESLPGYKSCN